jgi:hypothetical protein
MYDTSLSRKKGAQQHCGGSITPEPHRGEPSPVVQGVGVAVGRYGLGLWWVMVAPVILGRAKRRKCQGAQDERKGGAETRALGASFCHAKLKSLLSSHPKLLHLVSSAPELAPATHSPTHTSNVYPNRAARSQCLLHRTARMDTNRCIHKARSSPTTPRRHSIKPCMHGIHPSMARPPPVPCCCCSSSSHTLRVITSWHASWAGLHCRPPWRTGTAACGREESAA